MQQAAGGSGCEAVLTRAVVTTAVVFYGLEFSNQLDSPVMVYLSNGNSLAMLRYGLWLFTTPVSQLGLWHACAGRGEGACLLGPPCTLMSSTLLHPLA